MNDRRRLNGPGGPTHAPVFATSLASAEALSRPHRRRAPDEQRKIFLQTGLTSTASGSAYLELQHPTPPSSPSVSTFTRTLLGNSSSPKVTVSVHGPRPLPRSAPYSPTLVLSTYLKFVPFATRRPRGYVRDAGERDLSAHLEAALRGVIVGDRWPKSGVDFFVTVLEGEESRWWDDPIGGEQNAGGAGDWGMMTVLAACITACSAAMIEAGIDCVDLVTGGVAAMLPAPKNHTRGSSNGQMQIIHDPSPSEHDDILAVCVVGYLASRDELVEVWLRGDLSTAHTVQLIDGAVDAAAGPRRVLEAVLRENFEAASSPSGEDSTAELARSTQKGKQNAKDVVMTG